MIGNEHSPFLHENIMKVAEIIKKLHENPELEIAIVMGGGNIWRYRDHKNLHLKRLPSDFLGMMSTLYNANCLKASLDEIAVPNAILSKIKCPDELAENYSSEKARAELGAGKIVILAGGTGESGYSTDTGAAMLASDAGCSELWKATKVNGIYTADPTKDESAEKIESISYADYLAKELGVMDLSAVEICSEKKILVRVFEFSAENFSVLAEGGEVGSKVE